MPRQQIPVAKTKIAAFALTGGVDQVSPQLALPPGVCRDALNFECNVHGGYTRIAGYERFDGQPSPAIATYTILTLSSVSGLAVGDACNGQTSGATAVVSTISGSNVGITKVVGTFQQGENFRKNPTTVIGTIDTLGATVSDRAVLAQYQYDASEQYRSDITTVPGSGQIRGIFEFGGVVYAFRNNAGGTAQDIYKSSTSGWTQVTLKYEISFTAGSGTEPSEGATLTQSAVSATLRRVVLESGSWASSSAAGRFIIDAPSGGSFSAGAFTAGVTATASGAESAITLSPNGRLEVDIGDCGNGLRVYGADGANRAFEFDGTILAPIDTGTAIDTPTHVRIHANHLFLSFGASIQHSSLATPYQWSATTGAGELLISENVTNFLPLPGDASIPAMAITGEKSIHILYGTGATDWNMVPLTPGVGCKEYLARALAGALLYNNTGVTSLDAVQAFGNFATTSLTFNLRDFVANHLGNTTTALINRAKSQYRVFYSDASELRLTVVGGKLVGGMPIQYPSAIMVACETANDVSYGGAADGYVYKLDTGTSFDGATLDAYFELIYAHQDALRANKRYYDLTMEAQGEGYAEFDLSYQLSWGDPTESQNTVSSTLTIDVSSVFWDVFTWDDFFFDGVSTQSLKHALNGSGENVALRVDSSSTLWPAWTANSLSLRYSVRTLTRA